MDTREVNEYGVRIGMLEGDGAGGYELSSSGLERTDLVDRLIYQLMNDVLPFGSEFVEEREYENGEGENPLEEDVASIADVREAVLRAVMDTLKIPKADEDKFEMAFSPFVQSDDDREEDEKLKTKDVRALLFFDAPVRDDKGLAENVLRALVGECRSNYLAPESDEATTQTIRVFVGSELAEERQV